MTDQTSKPKWACGEWYVEDFYERMQRFRVKSTYKRGTSGTTICALGSPRPGRTEENNPYKNIDAEDRANAHLIAAAPELAEGVAWLLRELPTNRDWMDPALERFLNHALTKALGIKK